MGRAVATLTTRRFARPSSHAAAANEYRDSGWRDEAAPVVRRVLRRTGLTSENRPSRPACRTNAGDPNGWPVASPAPLVAPPRPTSAHDRSRISRRARRAGRRVVRRRGVLDRDVPAHVPRRALRRRRARGRPGARPRAGGAGGRRGGAGSGGARPGVRPRPAQPRAGRARVRGHRRRPERVPAGPGARAGGGRRGGRSRKRGRGRGRRRGVGACRHARRGAARRLRPRRVPGHVVRLLRRRRRQPARAGPGRGQPEAGRRVRGGRGWQRGARPRVPPGRRARPTGRRGRAGGAPPPGDRRLEPARERVDRDRGRGRTHDRPSSSPGEPLVVQRAAGRGREVHRRQAQLAGQRAEERPRRDLRRARPEVRVDEAVQPV